MGMMRMGGNIYQNTQSLNLVEIGNQYHSLERY